MPVIGEGGALKPAALPLIGCLWEEAGHGIWGYYRNRVQHITLFGAICEKNAWQCPQVKSQNSSLHSRDPHSLKPKRDAAITPHSQILPLLLVHESEAILFNRANQHSTKQLKNGGDPNKIYNFGTWPWISTKSGTHVTDSLVWLCVKYGDIWADGFHVQGFKSKTAPPLCRYWWPLLSVNLNRSNTLKKLNLFF